MESPFHSEYFRLKPFDHQARIFEQCKNLQAFGLWLEMGTGKSAIVIARSAYLYSQGEINTVLVLAPKAVAPNWEDEVRTHLPEHLQSETQFFVWNTGKAASKGYQAEVKEFLGKRDGLTFVAMSYDSVMTESKPGQKLIKGKEFAQKMLKDPSRQTLLVLDECVRIKEPNAKRTKRVQAMAPHAKYRMALTGTPVTNSPFDVFSPIKFLRPDVLDQIGCRSFAAFKSRFGVWQEFVRRDNGRAFKQLLEYRDLDKLHEIIDGIGTRVLKEDVLDLPPKTYKKIEFDMIPKQQALYRQLRDEFMLMLEGDGMITAPLAITRMLRLQQVTSGYIPLDSEDCSGTQKILEFDSNPRIETLRDIVQDIPHSFIVFAKFRRDIELIMEMLKGLDISAVRYDGSTSQEDREIARHGFQAGDFRAFVANPSAAGEGLTLHRAKTVIFYNTTFKMAERLQAEDRAHRIGQNHPVSYIDIVAKGTIDRHIVSALRTKKDIADLITGDNPREWL